MEIRLCACGETDVSYHTCLFGFHRNLTGIKVYVISSDSGEEYGRSQVAGAEVLL